MKLAHYQLETPILIDESAVNILVLENPKQFLQLTQELFSQCGGESGNFVLSNEEQPINWARETDFISDFLSFKLNNKKTQNLLIKKISALSTDSSLQIQFAEINSQIQEYFSKLITAIDLPVVFKEESSPEEFLKLYDIALEEKEIPLLEKLITYIDVVIELKNLKIIFLLHAKSFFTQDEICSLYKHCYYQKVSLVLVENAYLSKNISYERVRIVDQDCCQIDIVNARNNDII